MQVASEPCYNVLRTSEQLGYSVHCGLRLTHRALGFVFVVVSGKPHLLRISESRVSLCIHLARKTQQAPCAILAARLHVVIG